MECGKATALSFNRRGTLLATGTAEGLVVIWDFGTKGVAKKYSGHTSAVNSVCWSRDGKHLASGSQDQTVILWDVLQGVEVNRVKLGSAVLMLSMSPREPFYCVVSFTDGSAALAVDLITSQQRQLPVLGDGDGAPGVVALLSKAGDMVILGQSRGGYLAVLDSATLDVLDSVKLPNSARVSSLSLSRKGNWLLVNCHDRVIRMFELELRRGGGSAGAVADFPQAKASSRPLLSDTGRLKHLRDFQSAVERCSWRACCFSSDSEHVIGASASKDAHHLYIWSRVYGDMERVLEGPKEAALAVCWHPLRSMLLSLSGAGRVLCWARIYSENWSAFAPDFLELDENLEYVEKEDEFDWKTPGNSASIAQGHASAADGSNGDVDGIDEDVDIMTQERHRFFSSDEEEDPAGQLHYLPAVIEEDVLPAAEEEAKLAGNGSHADAGMQLVKEEVKDVDKDVKMADAPKAEALPEVRTTRPAKRGHKSGS